DLNQLLSAIGTFPISLVPATFVLPEVIITNYMTDGINANILDHSLDVDMQNLALLPGETDGDILESIRVMPGVNAPDGRAGNIFIRGSSTDQSLILYDDIPVYHRGHFFGSISPYNPKVVSGISVYRNGFSPEIGGRVGGAIDIQSRNDVLDSAQFGALINALNGAAFLSAPIKKGKTGIVLAARHSLPTSWSSPKLEAISDMVYQSTKVESADAAGQLFNFNINYNDANLKLVHQLGERHLLSLSSLYVLNEMSYQARENVIIDESNRLRNLGFNVKLASDLSSHLKSELSVTSSSYDYEFLSRASNRSTGRVEANNDSRNKLNDFNAQLIITALIDEEDVLSVGSAISNQKTEFNSHRAGGDSAFAMGSNLDTMRLISSTTLSPFVNYQLGRLENLHLQIGVRATYYSQLKDFVMAPRIFANYDISKALQVKGAFGLYNQYISQVKNLQFSSAGFENELWWLADGTETEVIRGQQLMVGALWQRGSWVIDVESYIKSTENIAYSKTTRFAEGNVTVLADAETRGIDFFVKNRFSDHLTGWASYSISKSIISFDTLSGTYYRTDFDQPHIFKFGGNYTSGRWKTSIGGRFMSGIYAQFPPRKLPPMSTRPQRPPGPPPGGPPPPRRREFPERYGNITQWDLSVSYTLPKTEKRDWKGQIGLSLLNIFNKSNQIDEQERIRDGMTLFEDQFAIGFAPNLQLSIEW
ncbi:MAG: TonB-dependent receptor, partial [Cyclobacteriaceae bacterium]|nr:TonB-dependent receptor [Cyclobacteriaceae bacterium HetDA_MAG_MS6]